MMNGAQQTTRTLSRSSTRDAGIERDQAKGGEWGVCPSVFSSGGKGRMVGQEEPILGKNGMSGREGIGLRKLQVR